MPLTTFGSAGVAGDALLAVALYIPLFVAPAADTAGALLEALVPVHEVAVIAVSSRRVDHDDTDYVVVTVL